ncbi:MAG: SUF system NifU family Fe-S cluster assembly protein, partial [Coprobacillus sp.]
EAKEIIDNYLNMIYEREYDEEMLEEAIAFKNTHKQANRIKCATLGWNGLSELIKESEE